MKDGALEQTARILAEGGRRIEHVYESGLCWKISKRGMVEL